METTFYNFDKIRWPIVVLTISGKPVNDSDFMNFLESWKLIYIESMTKGERFKLIFDVRLAEMITFEHLKQLGKWLQKMKELTERWMDRTAIIVSNDSIQVLIQFVFTLYKAVRPFKIFTDKKNLSDAILWLNNKDDKGDLDIFDSKLSNLDKEEKFNMIKNQYLN